MRAGRWWAARWRFAAWQRWHGSSGGSGGVAAGQKQGGYNDGVDDGPPSSPTDGEHNNAAASNDQCDAAAADVNRGDVDAGTSSIILAASNTLNHNNTVISTPPKSPPR